MDKQSAELSVLNRVVVVRDYFDVSRSCGEMASSEPAWSEQEAVQKVLRRAEVSRVCSITSLYIMIILLIMSCYSFLNSSNSYVDCSSLAASAGIGNVQDKTWARKAGS